MRRSLGSHDDAQLGGPPFRQGITSGHRLIVTVEAEGELRVVSAREQAKRLRGLYRHLAPRRSLADVLIAERREEARDHAT